MKRNINKVVLSVVVILFTAFVFSCRTVRPQKVGIQHYHTDKTIKVYMVLTKSGETITFPNYRPARLKDRLITGRIPTDAFGVTSRRVSIPLEEVEKIWVKKFSLGKTLYNSTIGVIDFVSDIEGPKKKKK